MATTGRSENRALDCIQILVRNQGKPHALQVFALLAEDKMTLFGFGNDEIELHLLSQHGGREREGMKGRVRHLHLQKRKGGNVSSMVRNLPLVKVVIQRGKLTSASTCHPAWLCEQCQKGKKGKHFIFQWLPRT